MFFRFVIPFGRLSAHWIDFNYSHNNLILLWLCGKGSYMSVAKQYEFYKAVKLDPNIVFKKKLSFDSNIMFDSAILI